MMAVGVLWFLATAALAVARTLRGRNTIADVVHPLIWLVPWHVASLGYVSVAAMAVTSAAWIAFTRNRG